MAGSGILPQQQVKTAAQLSLSGNKSYLTLQARVRKQRLGTAIIAEAAASVEGLPAAGVANHAIQITPTVPDGALEIITYYYDVPLEDSITGTGAIRLRVTLQ